MVLKKIRRFNFLIKESLRSREMLNSKVINNYAGLSLNFLFPPLLLIGSIFFFLFIKEAISIDAYVQIQKDLFIYMNAILSQFPNVQFNLTQLGDIVVFLPFLTILLVYAPKFWESLITSLLISGIFSVLLKRLFAVPRPAAIFGDDSFVVIGRMLCSPNSLPSGHSIATFTVLTSLLFAFMPKETKFKIVWSLCILAIGSLIVLSRVGVAAHYPLDVLIGSVIGYTTAVLGIIIANKIDIWSWLKKKKYFPLLIALLFIWAIFLVKKILDINLIILYFALFSFIPTIYIIIITYAKERF